MSLLSFYSGQYNALIELLKIDMITDDKVGESNLLSLKKVGRT